MSCITGNTLLPCKEDVLVNDDEPSPIPTAVLKDKDSPGLGSAEEGFQPSKTDEHSIEQASDVPQSSICTEVAVSTKQPSHSVSKVQLSKRKPLLLLTLTLVTIVIVFGLVIANCRSASSFTTSDSGSSSSFIATNSDDLSTDSPSALGFGPSTDYPILSHSDVLGLQASVASSDHEATWSRGTTAINSESGQVKIGIPNGTRAGDMLVLFLSRTDDVLPIQMQGWERAGECFKTYNSQARCLLASDCINQTGNYCLDFTGGHGQDLATVVFYRVATTNEPPSLTLSIEGAFSHTWAILTAIYGVDIANPIRSFAGTSCDKSRSSIFPSVDGNLDDVLLLSQCFDDSAAKEDFVSPPGTELLGWTNGTDEAGFLFGKLLNQTGATGELETGGPGGPYCKDALIALVLERGPPQTLSPTDAPTEALSACRKNAYLYQHLMWFGGVVYGLVLD